MHDRTDHTDARQGCPPWCERDHAPGVHPDDQHHVSACRRVPVIIGEPAVEPDDLAVPEAVVARLVRRTHSPLTWVEVRSEEGPHVRLVTTFESAERLLEVLRDLVAEARV